MDDIKNDNLDPRQDLTEDSKAWQCVLLLACLGDEEAYQALRGLRSLGCNLKAGSETQGMVFAFPNTITDDEKNIAKKHIAPHADRVKSVFKRTWLAIMGKTPMPRYTNRVRDKGKYTK